VASFGNDHSPEHPDSNVAAREEQLGSNLDPRHEHSDSKFD
jgi:hypothetical protein